MELVLSPSMLAADFNILGQQLEEVEKAGAQYLHFDVMDGLFVPSISFGLPVLASIRMRSHLFFDVHLMIVDPIRYIEEFSKAGANGITFHLEAANGQVDETIDKIRENGCKVGLSIKPGTPVESLRPYIEKIDMVLLMTVEPGFGGQKYIEESTERIRRVREMINEIKPEVRLEVDGGVGKEKAGVVTGAGADTIVSGTAVFHGDIDSNIKGLFQAAQK